ncbi:hypothetical protein [Xanthomarina gelatinilytica]|uniref:hypothetical protein n=1 Tax=Xanthomarina gelatinilytica TaxID=1137281 RepID=UPI003AA7B065
MKKIFTILLCCISFSVFAQLEVVQTEKPIQIGKISNLGQLSIECEKYGERYVFTYQDVKFQQIINYKTFTLNNEQTFNELYNLIVKNWDNPPKEDIMIKLEEGYLWVKFARALGTTNVGFAHSVDENADVIGISTWLTKRRLDKLFGKD